MNISEIKASLGYATLQLNTATKDNQPTSWLRHWDNDKRIAVSIHKDTFDAIKAGNVTTLGIQTETRTSSESGLEYTAHRIVMYTPAEYEL